MFLYSKGTEFPKGQLEAFRKRFCNLSQNVKGIKEAFFRFYNRKKKRRGSLWGKRFKYVIVGKGKAVINCLAYYRLIHHEGGGCEAAGGLPLTCPGTPCADWNMNGFLSLDFGLAEYGMVCTEVFFACALVPYLVSSIPVVLMQKMRA